MAHLHRALLRSTHAAPHDPRLFRAHEHIDVITIWESSFGRGFLDRGWRWSADGTPIAATPSVDVAARPSMDPSS